MATVSAPDLGATERAWAHRLGHKVVDRGVIDDDLARSWEAPGQKGRPYTLLTPASGAEVYIRLVEGVHGPEGGAPPRTSLGWAALELTVQDADALCAELRGSEFEIIAEPQLLNFTDKIYPMQAVGLAGEVLYLNEVRGDLPSFDLPPAKTFVDHIFIVILAAPDLDKALDFYRSQLGLERGDTYDIPYKVINDAFGLPPDQHHQLATAGLGRDVFIEIDQYPEGTPPRGATPGMLPPATAAVSFTAEDIDSLKVPWISRPSERQEVPYGGRRVGTCRGAAGELIELIEARPGEKTCY